MRRNPLLILVFDLVVAATLIYGPILLTGRWNDPKFHASPFGWFLVILVYAFVPAVVYFFGVQAPILGSTPSRRHVFSISLICAVIVWFVLTEGIVLATDTLRDQGGWRYQLGFLPAFLVGGVVCGLLAALPLKKPGRIL